MAFIGIILRCILNQYKKGFELIIYIVRPHAQLRIITYTKTKVSQIVTTFSYFVLKDQLESFGLTMYQHFINIGFSFRVGGMNLVVKVPRFKTEYLDIDDSTTMILTTGIPVIFKMSNSAITVFPSINGLSSKFFCVV